MNKDHPEDTSEIFKDWRLEDIANGENGLSFYWVCRVKGPDWPSDFEILLRPEPVLILSDLALYDGGRTLSVPEKRILVDLPSILYDKDKDGRYSASTIAISSRYDFLEIRP